MRTFKIAGRELRCIESMPPGVIFDLADAVTDGGVMAQVAAIRKLLYACVVDEDLEQLKAILYDRQNVVPFEDLNAAVGELISDYTGRPSQRPSDSQAGGEPTPPPSRVVSLSRGTVKEAETSSPDGQSAAS